MNSRTLKIGIIGAGGWGTAIGSLLCEFHSNILIWTHEDNVNSEINTSHTNNNYLPNVQLNEKLISSQNPELINECDIIVNAIPTQYIREAFDKYHFDINGKLLVNLAKGVERDSLLRMSELFSEIANIPSDKYIVLTGPSHAEEVARHVPTTLVAASENYASAEVVQKAFSSPTFRIYTSQDVIGCEIGGSLKNVIAIAAGIIDGLKLGDNTKAALITRGLAEINRLGSSLGANPHTFSGLSGLGDLYVTCSSKYSRNRYVGEQIGAGRKLKEILSEMKMVAEGVTTTQSAYSLAQKHSVDVPITEQMYKILFHDADPLQSISKLMTRQSKRELWW